MKDTLAPELRAALWMIGSILSFSFMAVAGRWLAEGYDTFEIMLYRSLTGIVIVFVFAAFFRNFERVEHALCPDPCDP